MSVSYLSGGSPRASEHRALTAELDSILLCLFGGHSPLVYRDIAVDAGFISDSNLFGDLFFFGDSGDWKIIPSFAPTATEYDHAAFTAIAAGMTVDHTDNTNGIAFVLDAGAWPLDGSLEAHRVNMVGDGEVDPRDFYLGLKEPVFEIFQTRERHRKLDVAEIIVEGWDHLTSFEWESNWDKYHFIRFHNLDPEALTVDLPGLAPFDIPPFGCKAVRRTYPHADEWNTAYTYLWQCLSGDSLLWDGYPANNVASMACMHRWFDDLDVVAGAASRGIGFHFDPTVVWDGSSIFHTTLTGGRRLGECYFHLGEFLGFEEADTVGTAARATPANWAALEGAGVAFLRATVAVDKSKVTIEATGTTPVDAAGVSTNLLPWHTTELPLDRFSPNQSITTTGAEAKTETLSYEWDDGSPQEETLDVDYAVTQNWGTPASVAPWDDLDAHAVLAYTGTPATTVPTLVWKTDGWRVVGHGTVTFPSSIGYFPERTENATITDTSLTIPFGGDALGRDTWDIMDTRGGRRLSPYLGETDAFDVVYHDGNPDVTGTYGLPDGIDWVESRGANTESTYVRLEANTPQQNTHTLPVRPCSDAADRFHANAETAGWYVSNRTAMLAADTEVTDRQQVLRSVILREHYNHLAQRLNSVVAVRPFTFRESWYYGELEDGGGTPWNANAGMATDPNPVGVYCYVLSTGSRAADLGLTVNSTTHDGDTAYWVSIADVADYAYSLGFKFHLERLECPAVVETDPINIFHVSENFGDDWRQHLDGTVLVTKFINSTTVIGTVPYGLIPPARWINSLYPYAVPVLTIVGDWRNPHSTPSGWSLDTGSRIMAHPHGIIAWGSDPVEVTENVPDFINYTPRADQPGEGVTAEAMASKFFLASNAAFSSGISTGSIASAGNHTLADDRAAFLVRLIPRYLYVRS